MPSRGVPGRGAVELVRLGGDHRRPPGVDGGALGLPGVGRGHGAVGPGVVAADRVAPLVVVLVTGQHQVDLVLVEQRQPGLADAEVGAVAGKRGGQRALVHEHHDHVHRRVVPRGRQGLLQPQGLQVGLAAARVGDQRVVLRVELQAAGVEPGVGGGAVRDLRAGGGLLRRGVRGVDHVVGRAVLVDDVVRVQRDELHGADLERVEVAPQPVAVPVGHAVVRQQEPAQVVAEAVRAVPVVARRALRPDPAGRLARLAGDRVGAELALVVAEGGHPRPVGRAARDVVAEVPPHARRVVDVQVGVAQVPVEQVEERRALPVARVLDRGDREPGVVAGLVPDVPRGVEVPGRGGQVAVAGEAELRPAVRRGLERRARRRRRVGAVADLVVVLRSGHQPLELHVVEVRGLPVEPVGEADRGRLPVPLGHVERLRVGHLDQPAGVVRGDRVGREGQRRGRLGDGAGRGPGHRDLGGWVAAPGEQQLLRRRGRRQRDRGGRRPAGAVAASARGARTTVPPIAATALTPTLPMMNRRRVNPGLLVVSPSKDSLMAATLGNPGEHDMAGAGPAASG